uniref:Penicillin-binding protein activator n=1 Tax=Candidatus Kentrum sp. FM TaxID=2126340 RepID=A0A450T4K2_9GAMM|nr:MAG: hypothetical protein BECKFM1743C_GA0114222_100251 [Candidatus Kentron sp. FM]VFJ61529.1 MAG: hypothetical protein BECKFM1743A_GA0114220_102862 [Candidatus Kentron sp. FM]VFK06749.1 MAG: hypothetical protein BECKFM1743B_GA0114221_100241 [Candidatus Kentron sp. FM]
MINKIIYILFGLIIAGCGTISDSTLPYADKDEQLDRRLISDGRFREIAEEYLRMASRTSPPRSHDYMLLAAGSYLDAKEPGIASGLLAKMDATQWTTEQRAHGYLLAARIALAEGNPEESFVSLRKIYSPHCDRRETHVPSHLPSHCGPDLPRSLWPDFFRTRALAYAALGGDNAFQALRDRIALDMLLTETSELEENHRAIWSLLSSFSPSFLSRAYLRPSFSQASIPLRDRILQGWLTLASITQQHLSKEVSPYSKSLSRTLASWRKRYPQHPAERFLLKEFMAIAQDEPPSHIALLLPLDGNFSGAAKAVHDGFLSAWLNDNEDIDRPVITIHNTVGADIQTLYNEVIDAGAEFVVGPLDKPSVTLLTKLSVLPKPTLTLNRATQTSGDKSQAQTTLESGASLYQFTLAPESEAEQVARRAWLDGHVRATILTPKTSWGRRMENTFTMTWKQLGGTIVDSQSFPNDNLEEISTIVQQLITNTGHKQPVPGDDDLGHKAMDCILMAAFPREARQLQPQLKFHHAGDVTIYATSHIFSGSINPVLDQDINGIVFGDMPWVLQNPEDETTLRNVVAATWPELAPKYVRYYAFGIDAYRIIPYLKGLRNRTFGSFKGETGELSVDSAGFVNRKLLWAHIHKGKPVISR